MSFHILRFNFPWARGSWHVVEASTLKDAIKKFTMGSHITASQVKVWKRKGALPKRLAGRGMLPKGWTP